MKKILLVAVMALGLSACNTISKVGKPIITKEQLEGKWVCMIKYDDLNALTADISDFKENGKIINKGRVFDYNFSPITLTYGTEDQGTWSLSGNRLVIDYDLSKREVSRLTSEKELKLLKQKKYQLVAKHEQSVFNILNNKENKGEDSLIKFDILKFEKAGLVLHIKQDVGNKSYFGACEPLAKVAAYAKEFKRVHLTEK